MNEETYGINKSQAHPNSLKRVTEDFFWDPVDELSPFGSDEGFTALEEFREWRKQNPTGSTYECLKWTIESVGEMKVQDYNESLADPELIKAQMDDQNFNVHQYIFTLDVSVIATGFAQLVDEGIIDERNNGLIRVAIKRQVNWASLQSDWPTKDEYIRRMKVLEEILNQ